MRLPIYGHYEGHYDESIHGHDYASHYYTAYGTLERYPGQNIGQNIGQNLGQNLGQNIGQNLGQNIGGYNIGGYNSPNDASETFEEENPSFALYAVGSDSFLKGSNSIKGPWVTLDDQLHIIDVTVVRHNPPAPAAVVPAPSQQQKLEMVFAPDEGSEDHELLALGRDQRLYIKDTRTTPWRPALPMTDRMRAIAVLYRQDGTILVIGHDYRRYTRADLAPATPWVAAYSNIESIRSIDEIPGTNKQVALGTNYRLYITDGYREPWVQLPTGVKFLKDVSVDRNTDGTSVERTNTVNNSTRLIAVGADNLVITRANLEINTPWMKHGPPNNTPNLCCVKRIAPANEHVDSDDIGSGTAGAEDWYIYFAIGTDKFLKGSNAFSDPWITLDERKAIMDVSVMQLPGNDHPSILAVSADDNLLYIKDTLAAPWRPALPASDPMRAVSVTVRSGADGSPPSIIAVGADLQRYIRKDIDAGTRWSRVVHRGYDRGLTRFMTVEDLPGSNAVISSGSGVMSPGVMSSGVMSPGVMSPGISVMDEGDQNVPSPRNPATLMPMRLQCAVGYDDGLLYMQDPASHVWVKVGAQQQPQQLHDATIDHDNGDMIIGVDMGDNSVITRSNFLDETPWIKRGTQSCCITKIAVGNRE